MDPQLGRWHVVDALVEKHLSSSPYAYVENDPVNRIDIPVFCVERNRWSYGKSGKFDKYFSVSSNSIRQKVIQDQNQSAVWEEVGKTVKKNNTETNTGTYTSLVNSKEYNKKLNEYLNFFLNSLKSKSNCIGFVGVSGDKIIGCDIFATPDLFKKQSETILNGYITEAIINGSKVEPTPKSPIFRNHIRMP